MSVYEKLSSTIADGDVEGYLDLLSDDYQFARHQSGETLGKEQMGDMVRAMAGSGQWSISNQRCLYENDDICVVHSVMSFPDGTREPVLSANLLKDGKIVRTETGATPLG